MFSKKHLAFILLFCCLSGLYLFGNDVYANGPEMYFYPEQKWSVNPVKSDDISTSVCSVKNQLNNGYIIEMSGDKRGFNKINIDFRQNAFSKGRKYKVHYLVPGASGTVITSEAVRESTITSDLKTYTDFTEEISNIGVMDVKIQDNSFRLYFTGLNAQMPVYNECVNAAKQNAEQNNVVQSVANQDAPSQKTAAAVPHEDLPDNSLKDTEGYIPPQPKTVTGVAPPHPPPSPSPSPSPSPKTIPVEDKSDIVAMKPESKLRPKISDKPRYIDMIAAKLNQKVKNSVPTKNETSNNLYDDINGFVSGENMGEKKHIKQEKSELPVIRENVIKNGKPIVIDFTSEENTQKHVSVDDNVAKRLSMIEPAASNSSDEDVVMNERKKEKEVEVEVEKKENEDFIHMRDKVSDLEKQVKNLSEKNELLEEELKTALQDAEKERVSVSSDNWNLERATMRFNEAERQIKRLGRQLQTQRAQCEREKVDLENMLFDPKLTSQKQLATLASMEKKLASTKAELQRQRRKYEERIKILEQQLEAQ